MMSVLKTHPLLKIVNGALKELPSPSALNSLWNFGSLLGLCLVIQLLSGIFLALHFSANVEVSFWAVSHMSRDVDMGWFLRMVHANGASLFFISLYTHLARGVWYGSYRLSATWSVGVVLLLLVMAAAFLGYVLPWGQMSFWGATVITNLFSALPYIGEDLVVWLWGGFAVDNATLTRFFTFHFLVPFVVLGLVGVHLLFLHESGSSNPLGLQMNADKAPFHPYFSMKDLVGAMMALIWLLTLVGLMPWVLGDPENFIEANPLVTPVHIQPEWYFLFAYAILRAIPNKLGGVLALAAAIIVFMTLPHTPVSNFQSSEFYVLNKILFWVFLNSAILLTWIGACPVEAPYIKVGQALTLVYFSFFVVLPLGKRVTDITLSYH